MLSSPLFLLSAPNAETSRSSPVRTYAKVFSGQCQLIELGFRQGGPAGFGLCRVRIDQSGAVKGELKRGEHKSLQTDQVILMPGPDFEVASINQIYRWLVEDDLPKLHPEIVSEDSKDKHPFCLIADVSEPC